MRKRTLARECALQVLYQLDISAEEVGAALANFWGSQDQEVAQDVKDFSAELVKGTRDGLPAIDKEIASFADNWQLDRMSAVDRNILRLGCYELLSRSDIPPKVTINEAVDLAKKFSGPEAGKFVNGILDKIKKEKKDS